MSSRASSSSPTSTSEWKYDVFLSFRGEDTRFGFTNHLYNSLKDQGMITFMDDQELQKGKLLSPELITAIEQSNFALIVLSPNYASSKWCLDELLKIIECMEARKTIFPIFYEVDPSHVRRQTGTFAEAFAKHEKRLMDDTEMVQWWRGALTKVSNFSGWNSKRLMDDTEKVQRWRSALTKVSNLSGWNSKEFRCELDLIKKIVADLRTQLRPALFSSILEDLIGIDSRVEAVNNLLLCEGKNDVRFIGIWGMGGIGKTTIAKVLFDRISYQFDFSSFIPNVRSEAERSGLVQLQMGLISKMLGREIDVRDVDEGATMIKRFVRDKMVLLVLDDINHSKQIEYLAGKQDWYGSGSIIIITTRDARLLDTHEVLRTSKEVQGLNFTEALQLFCKYAFKKDHPEQSYRDMSEQVVKYTKGLPLALKVLGSFLHKRNESVWKSALTSLRKGCNKEIFETLKISYDDLSDNEKKIFLDIACFYIGYTEHALRRVLNFCGLDAAIGIEVLMERSLVTISDAGIVLMHDLLQEMGLEIVRRESPDEPGKRSRLCLQEDVIHVLANNKGSEAVEGIVLRGNKDAHTELHLPGKSFSKMTNLRVLLIYGVGVHLSDGLVYVSSELRNLVWWDCPLQSLASLNSLENLQELQMCNTQIEYLWEGKKHLYSLKRISLSHSLNLLKTPDFSGCPNLEELDLEGCIRLYEIDSSVGFLGRLTHMYLNGCRNLKILPSSLSGLKSLKLLYLDNCSKLEKLPEDLGHIESLEILNVNGTALRELPSCTGLQNLKKLLFYGCRGPPISKLLPSFAGLHSLTKLDCSYCNLLEGAIPNDLGCLSSLTKLRLESNQFVTLPVSLSQLYRLQLLNLADCYNLRELPHLPSHVDVCARNCISLEIVPKHLSRAYFGNCLKLVRQGCDSVAFTSMKRHLQDQARRVTYFRFVIPGNNIPEWFDHQVVGASVSIDLHPGWFNKEFVGFALCFVYAVQGHRQLPPLLMIANQISCIVKVDGLELYSARINYNFQRVVRQAVSDHLFFIFDHSLSSYFRHVDTTELKQIEFSFRVTQWLGLVVKKCGVRLVYKQDVAEVNQCNAEISEEALEVPPCDDFGKAAIVSPISERGLPHSSGEGSSASAFSFYNVKGWSLVLMKFWVRLVTLWGRHETEVKQSNARGDYRGAFSFYKEPRPDSLKTLRSGRDQTPHSPTYLSDLIKLYPKRGLVPLSRRKRMIK